MNSVNWGYWLEDAMIAFIGAEVPLIEHQTRATVIDFCNMSEAWRTDTTALDVLVGRSHYSFDRPIQDTEICKVLALFLDGKQLPLQSYADMAATSDLFTRKGKVQSAFIEYDNKVMLYPIPDASQPDGLMARVAIRPSRSAKTMNEYVAKRYYEIILNGLKARMYAIPNKPWSDLGSSTVYQTRFKDGCAKARRESHFGQGRVAARTKPLFINGR